MPLIPGILARVSQDIACGTANVATLDRKGAAMTQRPLPSRLSPWPDGLIFTSGAQRLDRAVFSTLK